MTGNLQDKNIVDLVGTGGDSANLFTFLQVQVLLLPPVPRLAKHGGPFRIEFYGSADLLESLGISIDLSPEQIAAGIDAGSRFHVCSESSRKAMKYALGPRKELGLRTLFNIVGPLTNPAGVKRQVIGVFAEHLCETVASSSLSLESDTLGGNPFERWFRRNIDSCCLTVVCELCNGRLDRYVVSPVDFDLPLQTLEGLDVQNACQSAEVIKRALAGDSDPIFKKAANMLAINAGATIYISGVASSFTEGVAKAIKF